MAKKKNSPQVINNIRELNLEIDYDKLAEAIVKAQEKSVAPNDKKEKIGFWRAVWLVVRLSESTGTGWLVNPNISLLHQRASCKPV